MLIISAACAIILLCQALKKADCFSFDCFSLGIVDLTFFLIVVASGLRPAPARHPPLQPLVPTILEMRNHG